MLGPTLFLIYMNNLPEVINVIIMLFADDANIYHRVKRNEQPAANSVQPILKNGGEWAKNWLMWFNFTKYHHTVNSEIFARILFSRIAFKHIF